MAESVLEDDCPLCERIMVYKSDHHLVPRSRGGHKKGTVLICRDCHDAIHALFSNKELENTYNSVDVLLSHETFSKTVKFLSKQDPNKRHKTKLSKRQRKRGRNG